MLMELASIPQEFGKQLRISRKYSLTFRQATSRGTRTGTGISHMRTSPMSGPSRRVMWQSLAGTLKVIIAWAGIAFRAAFASDTRWKMGRGSPRTAPLVHGMNPVSRDSQPIIAASDPYLRGNRRNHLTGYIR